jgi:hypothetical protein
MYCRRIRTVPFDDSAKPEAETQDVHPELSPAFRHNQQLHKEQDERLRLLSQRVVRLRLHRNEVLDLLTLVDQRYWYLRQTRQTHNEDWFELRRLRMKLEKASKMFDNFAYEIEQKQLEARGDQTSSEEW